MSPRSIVWAICRPRRASSRSTAKAIAKATTSATAALTHASCSRQNSSIVVARSAAGMGAHTIRRPRAILLDAMGTLLAFEPPAPHLRSALRARLGVDVGEEAAARAIAAEIAYYRAHLHEGRDAAGLAALRRASAEAMRPALPPPAADACGALLTDALLESLRFHAFPEAPRALADLRARGIRLVVVSNWDVSLHERLAETGLAPLIDGAVASAELGAAKPDGAIFA